jgi:DNA polymerase III delta prime subunit
MTGERVYESGFIEKEPSVNTPETTLSKLIEFYTNGQLAQVYLFYGAYGETAELLAAHVLASSTHMAKDYVAKHIKNRTFPNFHCVESENHEITVEKARELSTFLQDTPTLQGWRVVIIRNAEALNVSASNAILKNMEELPEKTTMILLAHTLYSIKSTILSRAQKVYFPYKSSPTEDFISKEARAQEWIATIERALKTKEMPQKEFVDAVANEAQMFAEIVKYYLYTQCMKDARRARNLSNKYDEVAEFATLAAGKSLSPAHFALGIFSVLIK